MIDTQQQYSKLNICGEISIIVVQVLQQEKRYAHKRTYTYSHIYIVWGRGGWERTYTYTSGDSSPICKRHLESMLKGIKSYLCLVQTGHVDIEEFWCGRNIVWNMESDQSFWITSSKHQGTMPKRIFSFSCSMQVIQFADLQFHLIK